ncbi:YeaH/YhbH family protein [Methylobacterium sp. WL116]|uniref:YeaH/YhbH family protein n=1 Tax=Methylobacterium sp. WL116 TaxID=2603889 RepID=UPI0011CC138F|nr:YeaH/YhbH family protein [Methylobacterium sp. WL116]TXM94538.1 YeaH/YhbH family protein [Methylobacterium sp. WL116]
MHIVDRRLNPGGKSLANRQRFLRRVKDVAQRAVRESAREKDIKDLGKDGRVTVPADGVREPRFSRQPGTGLQDHILPGNKTYVEGDRIERPQGGGGGRGSGEGGDGGENNEDAFRFVLTREEFLELFLEDLELPDLAKRRLAVVETEGLRRAGYTVTGSPANLALTRTLRNSMSRRIPYVDPIDLRYRRFEPYPRPIAQAVMFCLMDVSGSMTEHMKDLAKRFYILLHIFLTRRYRHVEIVFIRHTDRATEVDEETFFGSRETGGTLVSSALVEMKRIIAERYDPNDWNIYAAQASDGDNVSSDGPTSTELLRAHILPACQHFAYLEVGDENGPRAGFVEHRTTLWRTYEAIAKAGGPIAMRKVNHRREIYAVFRDLFGRKDARAEAES